MGSQWWNDAADTAEEQEQQLAALWERISSTPGNFVLVTHSNLVRRLSDLLADKFVAAEGVGAELPTDLANARASKLKNCGVLGLRFRQAGADWVVTDAQLFGSEFEE